MYTCVLFYIATHTLRLFSMTTKAVTFTIADTTSTTPTLTAINTLSTPSTSSQPSSDDQSGTRLVIHTSTMYNTGIYALMYICM